MRIKIKIKKRFYTIKSNILYSDEVDGLQYFIY